jgi:phosphatidylglycerophosphate synthase
VTKQIEQTFNSQEQVSNSPEQINPQKQLLTPQNSPLRIITKKIGGNFVGKLIDLMPWINPNHLTGLGVVSVGACCFYMAYLEKKGKLINKKIIELLILYVLASSPDMLDGELAREKNRRNPDSHNSKIGQIIDSLADRIQEAFLSWLGMYRAVEHQDKLWLTTAFLKAITNPLSSLTRALAESKGKFVPEIGQGFGVLGTRLGKFVTGSLTMVPKVEIKIKKEAGEKNFSLQALLNVITILATIKTAIDRFQIALGDNKGGTTNHQDDGVDGNDGIENKNSKTSNEHHSNIAKSKQQEAVQRLKVLLTLTGILSGISLFLLKKLTKNKFTSSKT